MTILDNQAPADDKSKDNLDPKKTDQPKPDEVPGWLKSAKDDKLKTGDALKTLGRFKGDTPDEIAVSYLSLRQKLGENPVALPGKDDTPEKWNEFYETHLGVPKDPTAYKSAIKLPEFAQNDESVNDFYITSKKLNLRIDQVQGVFNYVADLAQKGEEQRLKNIEKEDNDNLAELTKAYGHDLGKNEKIVDLVLTRLFPAGSDKILKEAGLHRNPKIFAGLFKCGSDFMGGDIKGLSGGIPPGGAKTKAELEQMMKDPRYSGIGGKKDPIYIEMVTNEFKKTFPEKKE